MSRLWILEHRNVKMCRLTNRLLAFGIKPTYVCFLFELKGFLVELTVYNLFLKAMLESIKHSIVLLQIAKVMSNSLKLVTVVRDNRF